MTSENVGSTIAPHYPCSITLEIYLTDGASVGKVEYVLPHGRHPSGESIHAAIKESIARVNEQTNSDKWRACDRHEFVGRVVEETYGQQITVTGPKDFSPLLLSDIMHVEPIPFIEEYRGPEMRDPLEITDHGTPQSETLIDMMVNASAAIRDIKAERNRQIAEEGWTAEHDDLHDHGELLRAAVLYYHYAKSAPERESEIDYQSQEPPLGWPWTREWWKPKSPRRDLVRAGALAHAEIDRLARAGRVFSHAEQKLGLIVKAIEQIDSTAASN